MEAGGGSGYSRRKDVPTKGCEMGMSSALPSTALRGTAVRGIVCPQHF